MDACTMIQFQNATLHPDKYLSRYKELRFEHETLSRTKYFAECRAELHGKRFMVYAPITTSSMARVLKAIETLSNGCNWIQINNNYTPPAPSKHINTLEIAHDAMLCDNHHCSIILEPLPDGILLAEALYTHTNKHLTAGLEELQDDLVRLDISINHLHPDSIIIDREHHWHVIRPYYASYGVGGDIEAFSKLKELIDRYSLNDTVNVTALHEGYAPYGFNTPINPLCEGLRRFESPEGVGFENEDGQIVIAAIYHHATDFTEDRSVIETHDHKMGIIDRRGRYIIEPRYDSIEFNTDYGVSRVVIDGREARFDYFGKQISDWVELKQS